MKKTLLLAVFSNLMLGVGAMAQTTLLSSGFEGPGFDKYWTIGVSQAINETPSDYPNGLNPWEKWSLTDDAGFGYVHSGDSAAFIGGTMYQEQTHDWLITPQIIIPDNGETTLNYWIWYHSEQSYVSKFYIMVYDCDNDVWEEGYLLANEFNSPLHYVEEYTFDLSPWMGKSIKIAFVKNGTYQLAMDDINIVTTGDDGLGQHGVADCHLYPNPVDDVLHVTASEPIKSLDLYDVTGAWLKHIPEGDVHVSCDALPAGVYFLKMTTTNGQCSLKFTKR